MATEQKHIEETLAGLGLSEKEVLVYLALLKNKGEGSTIEASRLSLLPRTTVYDVLLTLKEKGLVLEKVRKHTKTFSVESPHYLFAYLQKRETDLAHSKHKLKHIINDLEALKNPMLPTPSLRQFMGEQGVRDMLATQISQSSLENQTLHIICNQPFLGSFQDHFKEISKQYIDQNFAVKVLLQTTEEDPIFIKIRNFEVKATNQKYVFAAGMDVIGDFVGYWTEIDSLVGQLMENQQIARLQAAMFEQVWNSIA